MDSILGKRKQSRNEMQVIFCAKIPLQRNSKDDSYNFNASGETLFNRSEIRGGKSS